jgi:hypothetical protein
VENGYFMLGIHEPSNNNNNSSIELLVFPNIATKKKWLVEISNNIWLLLVNKRTRHFIVCNIQDFFRVAYFADIS